MRVALRVDVSSGAAAISPTGEMQAARSSSLEGSRFGALLDDLGGFGEPLAAGSSKTSVRSAIVPDGGGANDTVHQVVPGRASLLMQNRQMAFVLPQAHSSKFLRMEAARKSELGKDTEVIKNSGVIIPGGGLAPTVDPNVTDARPQSAGPEGKGKDEPWTAQAQVGSSAPEAAGAGADLAFAMRITRKAGDGFHSPTASVETAAAATDALGAAGSSHQGAAVQAAAGATQVRVADVSQGMPQGFVVDGGQAAPSQQPFLVQGASPPVRTEVNERVKQPTTPVQSAHVQVVGADNQRVDVRLLQHGGDLSVSVRSSDLTLTRALQDHMPELTTRLESQQYHAEAWAPPSGTDTAAGDRDGRSSGDGGTRHGGNGPQDQGEREGNRPKWIDEMAQTKGSSITKEILYGSSE
ncbi:MAG: hypothetical protein JOY54_20155 [Acidobacteriaceae bacterium]|nr:hypothetical protein [Acidobacteriaceae bacterium]